MEAGIERDELYIHYRIADKPGGTGARQSGESMRNEVLNLYHELRRPVVLDFEGVSFISSAFADEFIGKMVVEMGFINFSNLVRLTGMTPLMQGIAERSAAQRMYEALNRGSKD